MVAIPESEAPGYIALKDNFAVMMANPESREMLMRAMKVAKPTVVNELDVAERATKPLREELTQTKAEIEALKKEWLATKAADAEQARIREYENAWTAQANGLKRSGYMDGAIEAIKKLAAERGIVSLEDAAAVYDKITPPAEVVTPRWGSLSLMDGSATQEGADSYMEKLFKGGGNAPGETRKQVNAAIMEARQQGRAA